ncbi:methyltransferase [Vibrio sp. SCSIO 43136]|uniref:methyltransferase n=1 Tax=Vibrio sp. SCSIO 43136 TaxID=2819101 RepID=UPI0020758B0C|nr:methyltransferase [Vibrio sp. SCSIO 43136]USD64705.1 methyltransferase [Vibrio sp. SCSIO 43136]
MNATLSLLERELTLHRFPKRNNETLQAWNAGDEYLITHVENELDLAPESKILLLNDHFGALACWFADKYRVFSQSDSYIAHQACQQNLAENQCRSITLLKSTDPLPSDIDLVLIQLPKNNRYLTWQLAQLRKYLSSSCPVIGVNKAKEIHTSTLKLISKYLGDNTTSLAWKKHRLVFSHATCEPLPNVAPAVEWSVAEHNISLKNLPNVYSGESLDLGARLLLEHLPNHDQFDHIIDLGCGNGVLSVKLAKLNPRAKITSVDESYMAVESARQNLNDNIGTSEQYQCVANNCLDNFAPMSADLVVCNPPFHQQLAITDHIAWQMFCDAKQVLTTDGALIVIGNRHLGYDVKLKRLFGKAQVKTIASNKKFVILQATKL